MPRTNSFMAAVILEVYWAFSVIPWPSAVSGTIWKGRVGGCPSVFFAVFLSPSKQMLDHHFISHPAI
jgi:hypothetical protein